jgi:hypothetical protein
VELHDRLMQKQDKEVHEAEVQYTEVVHMEKCTTTFGTKKNKKIEPLQCFLCNH